MCHTKEAESSALADHPTIFVIQFRDNVVSIFARLCLCHGQSYGREVRNLGPVVFFRDALTAFMRPSSSSTFRATLNKRHNVVHKDLAHPVNTPQNIKVVRQFDRFCWICIQPFKIIDITRIIYLILRPRLFQDSTTSRDL